jgi:Polysaccharide deacetylase
MILTYLLEVICSRCSAEPRESIGSHSQSRSIIIYASYVCGFTNMNICQLTRLSNTAIRNTRALILSILTTFLVILIWSPSTGFSSIIDSSQSSLVNNSSTAVSSNKNNKVVVLTFDDGLKSQYTNAKPILDTYGYKASFSIICEDVGKADHMSWQEINTLEKEGQDIGAHTITHRSLTEIPPEEMMFEVSGSKQCLIDNGIEDVNYFSYPENEGSADKAVVETVSQNYDLD